MIPLYYGGEPKNLGLVSALPQLSFADLVKEVYANPIILPLTRTQFAELPEKDPTASRDRQRVKRTRFVIPGTVPNTSERRTENVQHCNLVFLDVDVAYADKSKTVVKEVPARGILDQLPQLVNVLAPFSFAVYHTASSTPELPRLRVVVEADALPPEHYALAVSTVARMLGLGQVTSESNVVCQPMFNPVMFRDDTTEPLIAENIAGRALTIEDLDGAVLPSSSRATGTPAGAADLDHLRPPVEDVTLDDARDAVSHLDPDMDRKAWLNVGAGLKHQFGDQGLDLWREWSQKGEKYPGDGELESQWRSLKRSPRGRLPVTIRSVFMQASEAGWENSKVVQKCYSSVNAWLSHEDRTETELMKDGIDRIAAAPLLSHVERGALVNKLGNALKALGVAVSRTDLTKQLRAAEREERGKGGDNKDTPAASLPKWAKGIHYVAEKNLFYLPRTGQRWTPEALDYTFSVNLITPDDEGGRPAVLPRFYLLNQIKCPKTDGFLYDPTNPDLVVVDYDSKKFINTYRRTYASEDVQQSDEAGALVLRHCELVFHRQSEATHVLDWISYIVQNPGAKILWAILMQGAEGCGKSVWFEMLRRCLGATNVKEVSANEVMNSNWTEWAAETQAVNIPEIRVVGESRHAVMNKLKTLISDRTISIAQRNTDTRSVPNFANYFLTTNHTDALALTENDRRYYVIFSRIQSKPEVRRLRESGHFQRLFDMLDSNPGGLRSWFLNRKISPSFDPVIAPESNYKAEMLDASATPLHRAVELALADNDNPLVAKDLVSTKSLRDILETDHRGLGKFSDQTLAAVLRELGFIAAGRDRIGDSRHSLWSRGKLPIQAVELAVLRQNNLDLL